eukprot:CAMPEP_0195513678 /NCGR_PEP_ID=MMETSP0794_2-20130614/5276_1 /TAXON_ID=515487 /ORGANISM="Stephanopyxis turris, Strain CCMP 815" /LENGTH=166 /DNA_ID=CAMNT_0040641749 /DNA_START=187 /DNA_END=687 /DNA_ORIENTATION=-
MTSDDSGMVDHKHRLASFAVSAALLILPLVSSPESSFAISKTAAQISIDSIPPTNVRVQIGDLPVVGKLLSGTYRRVDTEASIAVGNALGGTSQPSVIIASPPDKVNAIKDLASKGHLEFDIDGIINTHLDIDVATTQPGELTIKVTSPLVPSLPFKNKANAATPQ